jgi:hypothetical protein
MQETQWFYAKNNQQVGPVNYETLRQMLVSGQLQPADLVWRDGMATWEPASRIPGLIAVPAQPATGGHPVAPPASQPQSPPQPYAPYAQPAPVQYRSPTTSNESQNGLAIAGFCLSFVMPLFGLIFSWIALSGMKRTGNREGHGLAVAGMVISLAWFGLGCLWFLAFFTCMGVGLAH